MSIGQVSVWSAFRLCLLSMTTLYEAYWALPPVFHFETSLTILIFSVSSLIPSDSSIMFEISCWATLVSIFERKSENVFLLSNKTLFMSVDEYDIAEEASILVPRLSSDIGVECCVGWTVGRWIEPKVSSRGPCETSVTWLEVNVARTSVILVSFSLIVCISVSIFAGAFCCSWRKTWSLKTSKQSSHSHMTFFNTQRAIVSQTPTQAAWKDFRQLPPQTTNPSLAVERQGALWAFHCFSLKHSSVKQWWWCAYQNVVRWGS